MTPRTFLRASRALVGPPPVSRDALRRYQAACLTPLIRHAWKNIPYYRQLMDEAGVRPQDIRSVQDLAAIPVTRRSDLQSCDAREICAPGIVHKPAVIEKTSGSSGTPLTIRRTWSEQNLLLAFRAQALERWGCNWKTRRAVIDHFSDRAPSNSIRPRFYERFKLLPRLVLDWRLPGKQLVAQLSAFRPDIISGPPTLLADVAHQLDDRDRDMLKGVRRLTTGSEQLFPADRRMIEAGFGKPLCDRYGCAEVIFIGMETPEQPGYRVCDEALIVEVLKDGLPARKGEIHITSLHQWSMPFIRYRLGDYVERMDSAEPHTFLRSIDGRVTDRFLLPGDRLIHGYTLGECIENSTLPVRRFQIVQEKRDFFRIFLVLDGGATVRASGLAQSLQSVLGYQARFVIETVDSLDRPHRKFYPFISLERYEASVSARLGSA